MNILVKRVAVKKVSGFASEYNTKVVLGKHGLIDGDFMVPVGSYLSWPSNMAKLGHDRARM